jgi:aspartate aminotransferase
MSLFHHFGALAAAQPDPFYAMGAAFQSDQREQKIDLTVGIYRDELGETPVMKAVRLAQHQIAGSECSKSYLGLSGNLLFNQLLLENTVLDPGAQQRAVVVQTPGASGALRLLADFVKRAKPDCTIWLSDPTYLNHQPIMEYAGLNLAYYPYFDQETKQVRTQDMLTQFAQLGPNDIVLLHGCCHNPTGADISIDDWKSIADLANERGFLPFVDLAYHGFGDGMEADLEPLNYLIRQVPEVLLAVSCSKNFGLYRERTGAAILIAENQHDALLAQGLIFEMLRGSYVMPPDHGAAVVAHILQDDDLKSIWRTELDGMQRRLASLRSQLFSEFENRGYGEMFDFIQSHKGMFSLVNLDAAQLEQLRLQYGVYMVAGGRINIAGLRSSQLPYLAESLIDVMTESNSFAAVC